MGPFHSGVRRDSLKRILPGSFRSGCEHPGAPAAEGFFQWLASWLKKFHAIFGLGAFTAHAF